MAMIGQQVSGRHDWMSADLAIREQRDFNLTNTAERSCSQFGGGEINATTKAFDTVAALKWMDDRLQHLFNIGDVILSVPGQMSGILLVSFHDAGILDPCKEKSGQSMMSNC